MPINAYTGLMRSGKSYEVVSQVIVPAIAEGRRVVTNVDGISDSLIRAYCVEKLGTKPDALGSVVHVTNEQVFQADFLPHYDDKKNAITDTIVQPGDLVAIDEAWRFWGTDCKIIKEHKSFFLEHGHFTHPTTGVACDLVLMIQDITTLHRFVRNVLAFNFLTHRKVSLGLESTYSITMWEGKTQRKGKEVGNWVRNYDKEIFPLYSSFKGGSQGKVVNADKRQNILLNKKLWFTAGFLVLGAVLSAFWLNRFFHPAPKAPPAAPGAPQAAKVAPGAPIVRQAEKPPVSPPGGPGEGLRVIGQIEIHGLPMVWLSDDAGRYRFESPTLFNFSGLRYAGQVDGKTVTYYSGARSVGAGASPSLSGAIGVSR